MNWIYLGIQVSIQKDVILKSVSVNLVISGEMQSAVLPLHYI